MGGAGGAPRYFLEKTIGLISELRLKFSRVVVASDLLIVGGAGGAPEYLATFHLLFMLLKRPRPFVLSFSVFLLIFDG